MHDLPLPYDIAAERAVLASVLLDPDTMFTLGDAITGVDFYLQKHELIFAAMVDCLGRREPPDLSTVASQLRARGDYDAVGGMPFLAEIATEPCAPSYAENYARVVRETAQARRLIEAGGQIQALGFDQRQPLAERLDAAERAVMAVAQDAGGETDRNTAELGASLRSFWERYSAISSGREDAGLRTGWPDLDRVALMRRTDTVIIAARPGVGKSALAAALAVNVARRGQHVALYSLEMPHEDISARVLAMESGIDLQALLRAQLSEHESRLAAAASDRLADLPLTLVDRSDLSAIGLRAHARRLHARRPLDLLIVDYLQLLVPGHAENRQVAVADISRGLKQLAMELRIPVVALSQLNRAVEGRAVKMPLLSDLRESGAIEQDASIVWALHRPELYDQSTEHAGMMEIGVLKNRNGPLTTVPLWFDGATMQLRQLARREEGR